MPKEKAAPAVGTKVKTATQGETGHAKNVTNFEKLGSYCKGLGSKYNPARNDQTLTSLQSKEQEGILVIAGMKKAVTNYGNGVHARANDFGGLKKFSTRVVNSFKACKLPANVKENAVSINKKIQGVSAKSVKAAPVAAAEADAPIIPDAATISVAQQSYDSFVEHFADLVSLVETHAEYSPNEPELQVAALKNMLIQLKSSNSRVVDATVVLGNARIARDTVLYTFETGMLDIAQSVKQYVLSVYGASSPEFKKVSKIAFKNVPQ